MIQQEPFPLKNLGLWFFMIAVSIVVIYFFFIACISINVGLNNMHQDGFWMPLLAGIVIVMACVCFFLLSFRFIMRRLKEKSGIIL